MTIEFIPDGTDDLGIVIPHTFKCANLHSSGILSPGKVQAIRTNFWGLKGVSEIRGGQLAISEENLHFDVTIHDQAFANDVTALWNYYNEISDLRGKHGLLNVIGPAPASFTQFFPAVTFEGFEPIVQNGQHEPEPVQLVQTNLNEIWWAYRGRLSFTSLERAAPVGPA